MEDPDVDVATMKVFAGQIAKDEARVTELAARKDALALKVDAARAKSEALYSPESLIALIRKNTRKQTMFVYAYAPRFAVASPERKRGTCRYARRANALAR
jgi:hypothetical protein